MYSRSIRSARTSVPRTHPDDRSDPWTAYDPEAMARRTALTSDRWARLRAGAGLGPAVVPVRSAAKVRAGWAIALLGPTIVTLFLHAVDEPADYRPTAWYLLLVVGSALFAGRRAF